MTDSAALYLCLRHSVAVFSLLQLLSAGAVYAEGHQQFATLENFALDSGEVVDSMTVGYRTAGRLNRDKSNVLVFPTWFTGTSADIFNSGLVGPGRLADSSRYHVIVIDALGNGVSWSPSNSPAAQGKAFPVPGIVDMVNSQYRLLREKLGIHDAHVVMGISMGGMQTFQWLTMYPGFMKYAVPIDGTPRMTSYDIIQWQTHRDLITTLQQSGTANRDIMDLLAGMIILTLWTPDYLVENVRPDEAAGFIRQEQKKYLNLDATNYLSQLDAMIRHDVDRYSENRGTVAGSGDDVKLMVVAILTDHMVNPGPALEYAAKRDAETLVLDNDCGHMGSTCELAYIAYRVNLFIGDASTW